MEYAKANKVPCSPVQFDDTPSNLESRTKNLIDGLFAVVDRLVKIPKERATFSSVVLPYILVENEFWRSRRLITFYGSISPKPELREAAGKACRQLRGADIRLFERRDLYEPLKLILDTEENNLDADYLYWLKNIVTWYEKSSLSIKDPEKAERYAAIERQLKNVTLEISSNLDGDKTGIWFIPEELAGLPSEFVESRRK
jgi:Zn-dependent oligopeptidase